MTQNTATDNKIKYSCYNGNKIQTTATVTDSNDTKNYYRQ